jgi:hypothetical protein
MLRPGLIGQDRVDVGIVRALVLNLPGGASELVRFEWQKRFSEPLRTASLQGVGWDHPQRIAPQDRAAGAGELVGHE